MCFTASAPDPYDEADRPGRYDNKEFEMANDPSPGLPAPSPVRQGIKDIYGNVKTGVTTTNDPDDTRPDHLRVNDDLNSVVLARDPSNPYQNFMENFRNSPGQRLNRFAGEGGIRNLSPVMALFDAITGKGGSKAINMTDESDKLSGQIFRQANANPGTITPTEDGLGLQIDTGTGTITLGKSGFATYSGDPNDDYEGVFKNIVNTNPSISGAGDDDTQNPKAPFDPCPEGFEFDEASQSCQPIEEESTAPELGNTFVRNTQPMPDLSRYGRDGGEYLFFSEMPGVPNPMKNGGPPKQPPGRVNGPGGPMDDLVGPIMLSDSEYVLPAAQVLEMGGGDYDRGIRRLDKQRLEALKKYKNRFASS